MSLPPFFSCPFPAPARGLMTTNRIRGVYGEEEEGSLSPFAPSRKRKASEVGVTGGITVGITVHFTGYRSQKGTRGGCSFLCGAPLPRALRLMLTYGREVRRGIVQIPPPPVPARALSPVSFCFPGKGSAFGGLLAHMTIPGPLILHGRPRPP